MDFFLNGQDPKSIAVYVVLLIWTLFWKGLALWNASRRESRKWFVVLLVLNTLGILEIVYLFFILKLRPRDLFKKADSSPTEGEK